ncbi:MAG: insulinase family protein [Armatimonadetes bacterium]|nr:insulinase family protein [Armatimonadota bacterium]
MAWTARVGLTCVLIGLMLLPPAGAAPARPRAGGPVRQVLEGGLTVIVEEHTAADIVALHTWVKVGSKDEDDETNGAAHFLEHMLFKGTAQRKPGQMDREVEGLGGTLNAATSTDWTYYYIVAGSRHFDQILDLQADAIMHSTIDAGEMARERRVVIEEINRRDNFPLTRAAELLRATAFTVHPYRRSVLGTRAGIERMPRDVLLNVSRTYYVPDNITVVVVGNIRASDALAKVRRAYAGFRRPPVVRPARPAEPPIPEVRRAVAEQDVRVTYLVMGFLAPDARDRDFYAADVLLYVLGRGLGARLRQEIVERQRLAQSIGASYPTSEDPPLFVISAVVDPSQADRAEAAILAELTAVRDQGLSEQELARAKNLFEGEHVYRTHTSGGRAFDLGFASTVADLEFGLSYLERVRQVTREDVQRVARRLFDPQRYAVAVIRPPVRQP